MFWKGRYKSQALLDEAALLTCMVYVGLNPVRAKMAKTPETSEYTSIQQRAKKISNDSTGKQPNDLKPFRSQGQNPDKAIPFALSSYLELVDWSGRVVRKDKRGSISAHTPPILERMNIDPDEWLKTIRWNNRFRRAIGSLQSLKIYANKIGNRWLPVPFASSVRVYIVFVCRSDDNAPAIYFSILLRTFSEGSLICMPIPA